MPLVNMVFVLCIFTQFINRQKKELTVSVVQNASVGQKDAQMSLFSLWKLIFQLPSAKRFDARVLALCSHVPYGCIYVGVV